MNKLAFILIAVLSTCTIKAQKYVGLDLARYSTIGHNGYQYHLKSAQIQYSKGIVLERQTEKIRYTTSIRWESFAFDEEPGCCDQVMVEGSYGGGELAIGVFNPYRDTEFQLVYGLQLVARSGRGELTISGGFVPSYKKYEPFYSSQILLAPSIGFSTKIHPRVRLSFIARTGGGLQIQERGVDLEGWTFGQSSLGFSMTTRFPFRSVY
jgi:hypothetical protein